MKKMTVRDDDGIAALVCRENCKGGPACFECEQKAVDRLADYEETDFTPQDIKDMHNELCLKCGNYKNAHLGACNECRWRIEK